MWCLYVSLPYLAAALAGFFFDLPDPVKDRTHYPYFTFIIDVM